MYFTGNDVYQDFLDFALMLNLITLHNNNKVTSWISSGVSPEKIKPIDTDLAPTRTNLANARISLKLNKSVLVQIKSSSVYSNCILNLYIVYELNA